MVEPSFPSAPVFPFDDRRHPRLGIASFVISLVSMFVFCLAFVLAFGYGVSNASTTPSLQSLQGSPTVIAFGLMILASPFLALVGAVLGFVAVFQKNTKKLFPTLGIVFNLLIILAFCVVLAIGLAGQSGALGL